MFAAEHIAEVRTAQFARVCLDKPLFAVAFAAVPVVDLLVASHSLLSSVVI